MTLDREDAARALADITKANLQVRRLRYYRDAAPILIMWGVIWLVCLPIADFSERWFMATAPLFIAGIIISARFGARRRRLNLDRLTLEERAAQPNMTLITVSLNLAFVGVVILFWPMGVREVNALIAFTAAGVYGCMGAWVGWRFSLIGGVLGAATLIGVLFIRDHYSLWMAASGGAAFIGSGLWLRRA